MGGAGINTWNGVIVRPYTRLSTRSLTPLGILPLVATPMVLRLKLGTEWRKLEPWGARLSEKVCPLCARWSTGGSG
jgi:hypothetical protein